MLCIFWKNKIGIHPYFILTFFFISQKALLAITIFVFYMLVEMRVSIFKYFSLRLVLGGWHVEL